MPQPFYGGGIKKPWNAAYISNNLPLSARNNGCTSIYNLRSLDVELDNNTQNQINGIEGLQFKGNVE